MFTLAQISTAHSRVKSGADFPKYIQELILIGVRSYETFVADGHTCFEGREGFRLDSPSKHEPLSVAAHSNAEQFKKILWEHQQGKSDYPTFCKQAAENGVEKWKVDTIRMTCTYVDRSGSVLLEEKIPG